MYMFQDLHSFWPYGQLPGWGHWMSLSQVQWFCIPASLTLVLGIHGYVGMSPENWRPKEIQRGAIWHSNHLHRTWPRAWWMTTRWPNWRGCWQLFGTKMTIKIFGDHETLSKSSRMSKISKFGYFEGLRIWCRHLAGASVWWDQILWYCAHNVAVGPAIFQSEIQVEVSCSSFNEKQLHCDYSCCCSSSILKTIDLLLISLRQSIACCLGIV